MLELASQSVAQREQVCARTGAQDLINEFGLRPFYNLCMKGNDRNYISISTKEVPTGLPGDTSLFANASWSLLRPPPFPAPPTEPPERVAERVRRAFRFAPGGMLLTPADKGLDVTRVFLRNVNVAATAAPAATAPARPSQTAGSGATAGSGGAPSGLGSGASKRRAALAAAAAAAPEASGSDQQQHSGDTTGFSHDSKRQRSNY